MMTAGKKPSTVRNAYFLVRQILGQAVADGCINANPADYVKLPTEHNTGTGGAVDDPSQFLTAAQVSALTDATPWPYNVAVHLSAWSGVRAGELAGLQVGDVSLPAVHNRPGTVQVDRTVARVGRDLVYLTPKTKGSRRKVPLTPQTTELLRDYLAEHPNRDKLDAPLFPAGCPRQSRPRRQCQPHRPRCAPTGRPIRWPHSRLTKPSAGWCSIGLAR
jgi:integrase